jgi:hypothetical protein
LSRDPNFDNARDELFAHIHRCGVLHASGGQQEWLEDTVEYLADRYPMLSREQFDELRTIGTRFCQPVIPHGKEHTALTVAEEPVAEELAAEETEMLAGAV